MTTEIILPTLASLEYCNYIDNDGEVILRLLDLK